MSFLTTIFLFMFGSICRGFNVDTRFPIPYRGPEGSYFGYTVALHRNSQGPLVLVGAPKTNSTTVTGNIYESGALFRCDISSDAVENLCTEIAVMDGGNTFTAGGGYDYSYTEKRDGMWLGVSLDVRQSETQNDTVVCGHLWKNTKHFRHTHHVNGICYVIDTDLNEDSVGKLMPLVDRTWQYATFSGRTEYLFAYGQAGISAAYSEDASHLILGAPGIFSWFGSFVSYPIYTGRMTATYGKPVVPSPSGDFDYNSYFGYSVSSGKFIKSQPLLYAVGAPRDADQHGMVYIVGVETQRLIMHKKKRGDQFSEYFGASILGVNINGDSFTDLLVGAPFNSLDSGGDEGKVYVYISNGKDLIKQTEITGERKPGARFGTAIANIGDTNQDGFPEIAIGAPYEDGYGAVYIYRCDKFGLIPIYEQRIDAIGRKLSGFGIHISRGLDIDDNGYPDILVGSYTSAKALLFRSRPIVHVFPTMYFNPKQIHTNVSCENSLLNLTCVEISACLYYTGKHVPSSLEFRFTVSIQDPRRRGFFEQDNSRVIMSRKTMYVNIQTRECHDFTMFLLPKIKDVINPIQVRFSHELKPPIGSEDSFDKTFPVYHRSSQLNITSQVPFHTGCGKADECRSNLYVTAKRLEPPESMEFITLGIVSNVTVEISIRNEGEPAYLSELHIYLPSALSIINQDKCENAGQQHNATLICDVGNPLKNNSQVEINIKLDITKIIPHTKYLKIEFKVVTISTETDLRDNIATLPIYPETIYDIGVTGLSSIDQIMYNGAGTLPTIISHTYIVRNYGPSRLQAVNFTLYLPKELVTSDGPKTILSFTGLDTDQKTRFSVPLSCDTSDLRIITVGTIPKKGGKTSDEDELTIERDEEVFNSTSSKKPIGPPSDLKMDAKTDKYTDVTDSGRQLEKDSGDKTKTPKQRSIRISCDMDNIRCIKLPCSASSFSRPSRYAEITVSFHINFTVLDKYLGPWYHLELITNSSIRVNDDQVMVHNLYPDTAEVKTDILHEGPPPPEKLQSWILYISVGVGMLLLLLILILLVKTGFFRRKEKDKMKKLIRESRREVKKEDQVTIKEEDQCEIVEES